MLIGDLESVHIWLDELLAEGWSVVHVEEIATGQFHVYAEDAE